MDRKQAIEWTGGLSSVSKMPGGSYGLPAIACKTGMRLRKVFGSVCSKCYGLKGHYPRPIVRSAQQRRLQSLQNGIKWVWGMSYLINNSKSEYFRWHDSGDIQNLKHLIMIAQVCMLTPNVKHRMPTKEFNIVNRYLKRYRLPDNLVIRVSSPMIGEKPLKVDKQLNTCTVGADASFLCPAGRTQSNVCGDCRVCWSRKVKNVDFRLH